MTIFRLDLRITSRETVTVNSVPAMQVAIVAENALNVTDKVFLLQYTSASTPPRIITFCAASDLENYPDVPPGPADEYVFYRAASVEFIDDRPSQVEEFIQNMYRRRDALLDTLKELYDHPVDTVSSYEV